MALNRPFIYGVQVIIPATSVNTGSILVGVGQTYDLWEIYTDVATAGVNIIGLRDSTGLQYTFASTTNPIPLSQLIYPTKVNPSSLFAFVKPLNLVGQIIFLVDISNTTGVSVTVNLGLKGFMTILGAT